jgi:hypothetical protein
MNFRITTILRTKWEKFHGRCFKLAIFSSEGGKQSSIHQSEKVTSEEMYEAKSLPDLIAAIALHDCLIFRLTEAPLERVEPSLAFGDRYR